MTARRLLQTARERGITIEAQAGRLRCAGPREALTPDLVAAIREHREELVRELEADFEDLVRLRVEAFTLEASRPGPVPFFVVPGSRDTPGGCLSCGEPLVDSYPPRCPACVEAARQVLAKLAQERPPAGPGGPPEARTTCCPDCGASGQWRRVSAPGRVFCLRCGVPVGPTGPGPPPQ